MRTITAFYDSRQDAEAARDELTGAGFLASDIQITAAEATTDASSSGGGESRGFLASLKDFFMPNEDRHAYSEGVRRGGCLLTARVDDEYADDACNILEDTNAVDFDTRQAAWASEGWQPDAWRDQGGQAAAEERTIPVIDEELSIGKREVERGGVRVRSYVKETPVEEAVSLREEHVEIERRPVNRPVSAAEGEAMFQERSIELTERSEEAVVAKEAFVREEIGIRKDVDERTETISDTIRHTEVEMDDTRGTGARFGGQQTQSQGQGFGGERASFADTDGDRDSSIAMEGEGGSSIGETEDERRERMARERATNPASRI